MEELDEVKEIYNAISFEVSKVNHIRDEYRKSDDATKDTYKAILRKLRDNVRQKIQHLVSCAVVKS